LWQRRHPTAPFILVSVELMPEVFLRHLTNLTATPLLTLPLCTSKVLTSSKHRSRRFIPTIRIAPHISILAEVVVAISGQPAITLAFATISASLVAPIHLLLMDYLSEGP